LTHKGICIKCVKIKAAGTSYLVPINKWPICLFSDGRYSCDDCRPRKKEDICNEPAALHRNIRKKSQGTQESRGTAMANQFLIEIHNYLSRHMEVADRAMQEAATLGDRQHQQFNAGKVDELKALRAYVSENFDLSTQEYY
jgi:hypothetical protein